MKVRFVFVLMFAAAFVASCRDDDLQGSGESTADQPSRGSAEKLLRREPYMGVSCRTPNSFACDRVGLAVWLREPALSVDATIAGSMLELDDPEWSGPAERRERRMFAGFLQPAGLTEGPLEVTPDAGPDRWIGREPVSTTVELRIVRDGGSATTTAVEVRLSPGWG